VVLQGKEENQREEKCIGKVYRAGNGDIGEWKREFAHACSSVPLARPAAVHI
jgi:hypothetical protein